MRCLQPGGKDVSHLQSLCCFLDLLVASFCRLWTGRYDILDKSLIKPFESWRFPTVKPAHLEVGDRVAIVSPCWGGPSVFPHRYQAGRACLKQIFGLDVVEMPHALKPAAWIEANPQARADDLHQAFEDETIKGIIAAIGGDDAIRLIPHVDLSVLPRNPKIFMGYSDISVLHFGCLKAGISSFYGPTVMSGFAENCGMHAFCPHISKIVYDLHRLSDVASDDCIDNPLRIRSFPRCADALLAPAIAATLQDEPKGRFFVELRNRRDLGVKRYDEGYDIMVMTKVSPAAPDASCIGRLPLCVLMSVKHALSQSSSLRVTDLEGYSMIQLDYGTMRQITDDLFNTAGIRPVERVATSSSHQAIQLAALGVGVFIVDRLIPDKGVFADICCVPLICDQSVDVVVKRAPGLADSPLLNRFLDNIELRLTTLAEAA